MGERCTVEGTVQHVIFQNEENGYTVLGLLTEEGELVTVVGCIPCVAPGEKLTADGLWVSHPSYGQQFAADDRCRDVVDCRTLLDRFTQRFERRFVVHVQSFTVGALRAE